MTQKNNIVHFINYAIGNGGAHLGAQHGPNTIKLAIERQNKLNSNWLDVIDTQSTLTQLKAYDLILSSCTKLAHCAKNYCSTTEPLFILGGDHSCAIGSISAASYKANGPVGLIWIDAHLDSHTLKSSESKNIHGMPVASLLGFGDKNLASVLTEKPKIDPKYTTMIGIRSYEKPEMELMKSLGIEVISANKASEIGIEKCIDKAFDKALKCPFGYTISIDLDAFDPQFTPGVSTAVAEGLDVDKTINQISTNLKHKPKPWLIDCVEFNPELDIKDKTLKCAVEIINKISSQYKK